MTKAPVPKKAMGELKKNQLSRGIIAYTSGPLGNVFKIRPPLIITKEEVEFIPNALKEATFEVLGSE